MARARPVALVAARPSDLAGAQSVSDVVQRFENNQRRLGCPDCGRAGTLGRRGVKRNSKAGVVFGLDTRCRECGRGVMGGQLTSLIDASERSSEDGFVTVDPPEQRNGYGGLPARLSSTEKGKETLEACNRGQNGVPVDRPEGPQSAAADNSHGISFRQTAPGTPALERKCRPLPPYWWSYVDRFRRSLNSSAAKRTELQTARARIAQMEQCKCKNSAAAAVPVSDEPPPSAPAPPTWADIVRVSAPPENEQGEARSDKSESESIFAVTVQSVRAELAKEREQPTPNGVYFGGLKRCPLGQLRKKLHRVVPSWALLSVSFVGAGIVEIVCHKPLLAQVVRSFKELELYYISDLDPRKPKTTHMTMAQARRACYICWYRCMQQAHFDSVRDMFCGLLHTVVAEAQFPEILPDPPQVGTAVKRARSPSPDVPCYRRQKSRVGPPPEASQ